MNVTKLNESYSSISGTPAELKAMYEFLKIERPGAYFEPLVKAGMKSPYDYFGVIQNKELIVMNGHLEVLKQFEVQIEKEEPDYTELELDTFLDSIRKKFPFEPYDYQELVFKECIKSKKLVAKCATGSGKSVMISLIAEFFRSKNKKGVLVVPNINLLEQFKNDIHSYGLQELYDNTHLIGGGNTEKHFDKSLTISTWQSLNNYKDDLHKLDYVMYDECHRSSAEVSSEIITDTTQCRYKFGFTGTVPDNPVAKMQLIGLFGLPRTFITSRELIERGLGTPIKINSIIFKYSQEDKKMFKNAGMYPKQLKFIKEHEARNEFVVNLIDKLRSTGNTLSLFQHTEHGKMLFMDVMGKLHPDVLVKNKDITGKKSFEFQEQYGVYFINGEDNAETREKTRNILEDHSDAVLIANFSVLSTGVNIKRLHNLVLASPLKSYTTVTQSIGRLMRLHPDKTEANVYDLVDDFGFRKPGGIFYKQYLHRIASSYNPEEFPIKEVEYNLF